MVVVVNDGAGSGCAVVVPTLMVVDGVGGSGVG